MVTLESRALAAFLIEHKLTNSHCTIHINKENSSVDYVFIDDTCTFQLHEDKPVSLEYDDTESVSFIVPNIIIFLDTKATLKLSYTPSIKMLELVCSVPNFTATTSCDDNHMGKIDDKGADYIPFSNYVYTNSAIRFLKPLATDLANSINVEFGKEMWAVSTSQCCIYSHASGLHGSISSELFSKIYDYEAEVSQPTATSLVVRKKYKDAYYLINVPIKDSVDFPKTLPNLVGSCKQEVCKSIITNDVSTIIGNIIKNVKKETVIAKFTNGRFDIIYDTNQVHLTTVPKDWKETGISIKIAVKTLISIVDLLSDEVTVMTNGEVICLMKGNKGLIFSGLILR